MLFNCDGTLFALYYSTLSTSLLSKHTHSLLFTSLDDSTQYPTRLDSTCLSAVPALYLLLIVGDDKRCTSSSVRLWCRCLCAGLYEGVLLRILEQNITIQDREVSTMATGGSFGGEVPR